MGAKKQQQFTLRVGFEFEKDQIAQVGQILDKNVSKVFSGHKSKEYFADITTAADKATKAVGEVFKAAGKPVKSQTEALRFVDDINKAFGTMGDMLLSLHGNITKTFKSIGNTEALTQFKALSASIDEMVTDSQKITELFNTHKGLGNQSALKSQIKAANKELAELKKNSSALTNEEKKRRRELNNIIKEGNDKLNEKKRIDAEINALKDKHGVSSQKELDSKITDAKSQQADLREGVMTEQEAETLKSILMQLRDVISSIAGASNKTKQEVKEDLTEQELAARKAEERMRTFRSVLQSIGLNFSLDWVIRQLKRVMKYSYEYVKNLDRALTEISVVSSKTRQEAMALTQTFIDLSARTGMAIDDIAQASTIFYQQGLSDSAVEKMTEWTALFAKISGETVQQAADQLTSAMNGFGYAADEVNTVVDKMSVLAAYSAADINELATAMEKGASAAAQAGLSFDQYNGYLATMIEVTREAPENIGTSLKTIMARFQQVKTEGTSEDGETDVNAVETALKSVGIQLRDSQNQLRDLGDVLDELGPRWNTLDRNTQAYLGTVIAGTRQQSRFISLMQNWDRALELIEASENSAGAATRMHAKAMDGLDASLNNLTNAWQNLISTLANGDTFKWLIDLGTKFLKWLAEGNSLLKIFAKTIQLLNLKSLIKNLNNIRQNKSYENLNTTLNSLKATTQSYKKTLAELGKEQSAETERVRAQARELDNLAASYNRAKAAKEGYASTPADGATTDVNGNPVIINNQPTKNKNKNTKKQKTEGTTKGDKGTLKGNITTILGSIQTFLLAFSLIVDAVDFVTDFIYVSSDEMKEKAQKEYDKTQKTMSKQLDLIETVETQGRVYDELSAKMNKSAEETEKLAEAAEALAEVAPEAIIGYDSEGNPIISTSQARASARATEQSLAGTAKTQIGNLGGISSAELRAAAEQKVESEGLHDEIATGAGITAGLTGAAAALALMPEPIITKGAAIVLGIVAAVSAGIAALSVGLKGAKVSQEQLNMAQEKATEVQQKYRSELLQYMSYITDAKLTDRKISGTTEQQRSEAAAYINSEWVKQKEQDLFNKLAKKEITAEEYEAAYKTMGTEWENVLGQIGETNLASGYKALMGLTEDIGSQTYSSMESAVTKIITGTMGISENDPLFETIKSAFLSAAYNGVGGGIDKLVKEMETRKANDPDNAAAYDKAINSLKSYTTDEAKFLDNVGLTDNVNVFNDVMASNGKQIRSSLQDSGKTDATLTSINALEAYKDKQEKLLKDSGISNWMEADYDTLTEYQQKIVKNIQDTSAAIETAWGQLPYSASKTWGTLFEEYEKITERTKTAYETMHKLTSGEGLSYDEFKTFATTLDTINLDAFDSGKVTEYAQAIDQVTASLYVENGALYMNAGAVKDIASLEKMLADAQKEEMRQTLLNRKAELEAAKAVVKAEIATIEYKIAAAKNSEDASDKKVAAEKAWNDASIEINKIFDANQAKISTAMVGHFSSAFTQVATKYNQLITGMNGEQISQDTLDNFKKEWEETTKDLNFKSYEKSLDNTPVEKLESKLKAALKVLESYEFQISNINLQLAVLDSGFRDTAEGTEEANKALKEYMSQLERFLKLLKHIEREQQNLSVAELFEEHKTGASYIDALDRQLEYTKHLIGDTQELYQKYEGEASKQATTILKGYGDLIKFDKWGNYDLDMEKFDALSEEQQKQLEDWLKTYDGLVDKRDEYYDQHLQYIMDELENNQKRVDAYIKAEDELVEAIKQREQDILDNKLAAIDKEIEAIEKAADARRKAREEENQAEELSGLQTDLQRALMDSSGASASQILEIQKQIKNKQQEIADNSFDTMVEDMTTQLEEEKEMEQKLFDERLEEMDWYWDEVDRIMSEGTDSILETMRLYLDEYNESSEIQQTELLKGWEDTFGRALAIGKEGTIELQKVIAGLQGEINGLVIDEDVLTDEAVNTKFDKRPGTKDTAKPSGGGKTTTTTTTNKNTKPNNTPQPTDKDDKPQESPTRYISLNPGNNKLIILQGKDGETVTLPGKADVSVGSGYSLIGWKDKDGKIVAGENGGTVKVDGHTSYFGVLRDEKNYWANSTKGNQLTGELKATGAWLPVKNASGVKQLQNIWEDTRNPGTFYYWKGSEGKYKLLSGIDGGKAVKLLNANLSQGKNQYYMGDGKWEQKALYQQHKSKVKHYLRGGMVYGTGPAWLDGTRTNPEAVLNAMQTKAFLQFTDDLAALRSSGNMTANNSVVIDTISFNVDSMSSVQDGERAFNAFVDKFKEIGAKQGISVLGTMNRN